MCGIVGLYYKDHARVVSEALIKGMCDRIVHRGPDDEGRLVDGCFGMGMRRLSIIDLEGGHQPIFNEDRTVATVFNGEIFNYPELKRELEGLGHTFSTRSDTEVLVHGYESWGAALPGKLNGMFAFSVWDSRARRILIARDHVGIKPLYIFEDDNVLAWASEVKALLELPFVNRALDERALVDYLTFGYVPAPSTLFSGITKLPAATSMIVENGKTCRKVYWDVAFEAEERPFSQWCEELRALLDDAVERQLVSDVPLGAFLSGGIDSTAIVTSMHHLGTADISTYAIGFGAEDSFHDETKKARLVARAIGSHHHEILVEPDVTELIDPLVYHLDEPVTDTSFIVSYLVSKLARESVTVILSGVGGDEIFGGYRRYLWPQVRDYYSLLPGPVDRHLVRPLVERLPVDRGSSSKSLFRYLRGFLAHADRPDAERYQGYVRVFGHDQLGSLLNRDLLNGTRLESSEQVATWYRQANADNPLARMLYADLKTALVDSLLAFTDKMSMAVSLEARVPLLDYRLIELAARMRSDIKIKGLCELKYVFKTALTDRFPPSLLKQKKQGFGTPISRWFRTSLREYLQDMLSPERIRARGLVDEKETWRMIDDHMSERADHSEHIMALLTLESWHRTFIDAGPPGA